MANPPKFRKTSSSIATDTPEELFYTLSGRAKTHGYLRGPQQDALRSYIAVHEPKDVAFELPTGSGKTMVGLLIAEWQRRRNGGRAAFLALTNQLASQVIEEGKRLHIPVTDLRGNKDRRSATEEGRFLDGSAIAVSTFSNLFNVNPVIRDCETLIFDDAHGGGEVVASMWTVRFSSTDDEEAYEELRATLLPLMTETQAAEIIEESGSNRVGIVDLAAALDVRAQIVQIIDEHVSGSSARYPWSLIRSHLHACHVLMSRDGVAIRPYIVPTYEHLPFAGAAKRIYMSATLGDVEDLQRAYAIERVEAIRTTSEHDGRRYVFVPGLSMDDAQVREAIAHIWKRLDPKRAVAIAPSFGALGRFQGELDGAIGKGRVAFLGAGHIEESLETFTGTTNTILSLANRYDGLDLPDDDCRLLMLVGSPRATNELEANLASVWKLGAALRWREATRLVQGMGRCTRNATDFAVILLLGESLINAATNNSLLQLLPTTLRREIEWGRSQLSDLELGPPSFAEMVVALIADHEYRREADALIAESGQRASPTNVEHRLASAAKEVAHSKAIWAGDFSRAHGLAREIVDLLSGEDLAGFRTWWLYLASLAAHHGGNLQAEKEALTRAKSTGINAGWLDQLLRSRSTTLSARKLTSDEAKAICAERIWNKLDELGWSGKRFGSYCSGMLSDLQTIKNHRHFHRGLEALGSLLGAEASRPNQQGDPDVIWRFGPKTWVCFEAKTEKQSEGTGISKKDVLEAKGHVDWVRFFQASNTKDAEIRAVIIAPVSKTHEAAKPHKSTIYFLGTTDILEWARKSYLSFMELRTRFAGHEFAEARQEFSRELTRLELDRGSTLATLCADEL